MTNKVLLVVGLGNPGPGYALNRHNVGAMVVDVLADRHGGGFKAHKAGAAVAEVRTGVGSGALKLILAKPTSFMNRSGGPTTNLLKFYGLNVADLIVVHDELDIPAMDVRLKQGGGHAGHNGLRDIIAALDTNDFARVRVGIGRPPGQQETADFVLQNFGTAERKELPVTLEIAADAVEAIGSDGVAKASQRFHSA